MLVVGPCALGYKTKEECFGVIAKTFLLSLHSRKPRVCNSAYTYIPPPDSGPCPYPV